MKRIVNAKQAVPSSVQSPGVDSDLKSVAFDIAAQAMWAYFRDNKSLLMVDVRLHRETILKELMRGAPVARVFEPYFRAAPVAARRK